MQKNIARLQEIDAEVIAFASRGEKDTQNVVDALDIGYRIVPGPSPKVFRQYGVLNSSNGLAVPAMFVIDKAGMLRWQWIAADSEARRPSVDALVRELKKAARP